MARDDPRLTHGGPRDATAFEVREALAGPGCAVCALVLRSVGRFIQSMAYERVNDLDLRAQLRASGGFCNVHAHRWLRDARSVLGTALIYRDVVTATLSDLDGKPGQRRGRIFGGRRRWTSDAGGGRQCLGCTAQRDAEDRYLSALSALLHEPADAALFDTSDGLCLVHTRAAVRRGDRTADMIVLRARLRAEQLVATLEEVIRKEDYRFRDEPRLSAERAAPVDVVAWTIGADGLTGTWDR